MDTYADGNGSTVETSEYQQASQPFVGQWDRLVSRTNWDKGRIIAEWREALVAAAAPPAEFSDDAWSKLVGGVTPQHVGRLRRTYTRFFEQLETYPSLYWSHFHAAVDWNDAELWLEGAKLNDWSVSQMRRKRWEQMGKIEAEPQAGEVVAAETDEDFDPQASAEATTEVRDPSEFGESAGPLHEGSDFGDEGAEASYDDGATDAAAEAAPFDEGPAPQRPFENLAALPADLHEAVESFKLAILHHKLSGWTEVTPDVVVAHLRALEQLAAAPS